MSVRVYKKILWGFLFISVLSYTQNINKLKAEIQQKENKLFIKISKNNEIIDEISISKNTQEIIYRIKKGDTLSQIALKYKKNIKKIAEDNHIKNIDLIITGKTLIIK